MQRQQPKPDQQPLPPSSLLTSNPTMPQPSNPTQSSNPTMAQTRNPTNSCNPLTLNIAIMFLFYALSITLCLSSFSTCVCVIFNPAGTFRTIANYLFYALGLSVLLTFVFVASIGIYFNQQASSPEPRQGQEIVEETLVAGQHEAVDAKSNQETHQQVSASQDLINSTPIHEEDYESPAPQAVVRNAITYDAYCEVVTAQEIEDAASTSEPAAFEDDTQKAHIDTATTADGTPRFGDEVSALLSEMIHAVQNAPTANDADRTEVASQDQGPASVITRRESRKIEKWISQTSIADAHAAKGILDGDDADADAEDEDEDTGEEKAKIMTCRLDNGSPRSENGSVSLDSDFQKTLRAYMGEGVKYGRRRRLSGNSTPSEESGFQGEFRNLFMPKESGEKKAGGKRKARSV